MEQKRVSLVSRAGHFLQHGVWETHCDQLPWYQRMVFYAVRLVSLVVSGFKSDQCVLHAASLTFFSLMALIPVLALTLAMARSFGGADLARELFNKKLHGWMEQIEQSAVEKRATATESDPGGEAQQAEFTQLFTTQVRDISDQLFEQIEQLKFGTLGGIGAVMLLWTVVGTLGKVESSFNRIWGIEQPRPLVRKCFDYLGVSLILPFLATAASSVPVATMITGFMENTVGGEISLAIGTLLHSTFFNLSVTLLIGTLTFAFLLGFMPNTRVKLIPTLVGGIITTILFGGWLKLCAMMQLGIGKYSVLFGSFAVLPILLLWVYVSWQIILLGAEVTFAVQNRDTYVLEQNAPGASLRSRLLLAITLCAESARCASEADGGPFDAVTFARQHGIPVRFVNEVLEELVRNQVLVRVADRPGEYLLYRCGSALNVAQVIRVMIDDGKPPESLGLASLGERIATFNLQLDCVMEDNFPAAVKTLLEQV